MRVLQLGYGAFGPTHLKAWLELGHGGGLWIADPDPAARARAATFNIPQERLVADFRDALDKIDVVDIVAATDLHVEHCLAALAAGKDVFVEKPLSLHVEEARRLADALAGSDRVLQVGYYFRHHPLSQFARQRVTAGELGALRYLKAEFAGFKRARKDVGATANDAVHFIDQINWLVGAPPLEVYAVQRDHFGRGLEDLSLILLTYPGGVVGQIETGYIQPGRHADNVTPNALTTKAIAICGSEGAIEIDYQAERLIWHRVRHRLHDDGFWRPVYDDARIPKLDPRGPVEVLMSEFAEFLGHVTARTQPEADVWRCGVDIAVVYEAIMRSAQMNRPVACAEVTQAA